ncbi:hypothetical protein BDN70DRAFT_998480 [Pholiota conissans]|uniref:F-box domain-containing protein n=1 Tax=Pholiota conissans TaxID=109636 RepID=A0A9P5YMS6_9AGAR|nr:hypothetical protein BDN70DRAFT_998480 [Pholiota conissans]
MPTLLRPMSPSEQSVPYDVLQEIFIHCIPERPFEDFSWTEIPVVLCHVSSFWRYVALTTPKLWSHLTYCLAREPSPLADIADGEQQRFVFRKNQIEYLKWWNKNRGSLRPFLEFYVIDIENESYEGLRDASLWVDEDSVDVLTVMKYVASAQFLQVNLGFWEFIYRKTAIGYQVFFPNLRSLVHDHISEYPFISDEFFVGSVATRNIIIPSLRRLSLQDNNGDDDEGIEIELTASLTFPSHWSTLTEVSFYGIDLSLGFWFRFMRSLPYLQWFSLYTGICDTSDYTVPMEYTHSHLTTLTISIFHFSSSPSVLFSHLHLPALQDLTLAFLCTPWKDDGITELCTILQSTPNISTLGLTTKFIDLHDPEYTEYEPVPGNVAGSEPIWRYCAPKLVHLRLEIDAVEGTMTAEHDFDVFINNLTTDNMWLRLEDRACPIRKVTFIDGASELIKAPGLAACRVHQVFRDLPHIEWQITPRPWRHAAFRIANEWSQKMFIL